MDIVDNASALEELARNSALANKKAVLPDTGLCHYCDEQIDTVHFCDVDCRDDYEQLNKVVR